VTAAENPNTPDLESASAFMTAAGLRLTHVGAERVEGTLDLGPEHHTPWGVVHGGVYTTAIESAASVGASAAVAERGQIAVGVNNTTDFLRSMTGEGHGHRHPRPARPHAAAVGRPDHRPGRAARRAGDGAPPERRAPAMTSGRRA
jgi:uncharacterized protein (TIGR00369 family)